MTSVLRRGSAAAVLFLLIAAAAPSRAQSIYGLDEPAPGGGSWADVLALAVGPLRRDGDGWLAGGLAALPNLDPGEDGQPPPEQARFTDVVVEAMTGSSGRYAILADTREFYAVAAVVDLAGAPGLVAAAGLAHDRSIALAGVLDLGGGASALDIVATHTNAGQGYRIDVLGLFDAGRLALVDSILTLSDLGCGYERRQEPSFVVHSGDARLADLEASITETVTRTDEECGSGAVIPASGERRVSVTYRWRDREGYAAATDVLSKFQEETQTRF